VTVKFLTWPSCPEAKGGLQLQAAENHGPCAQRDLSGASTVFTMPTLTLLRMQQNNSTNNAVENADVWALARNPVYRRMQQKLIERTAERDTLR